MLLLHESFIDRKANMISGLLSRQGQRLLQVGMLLIFYSSFDGFAIPFLRSERIGLSVHTLSAFQGVFLLAGTVLASPEAWRRRGAHRLLAVDLCHARHPCRMHDRRDLRRWKRAQSSHGRATARAC
jgi:hypothetical protein